MAILWESHIPVVRILLQNRRSKFYFRCGNAWTSDPSAAFDFESSEAITRFVQKRNLQDVQVILRTEQPERCDPVPLDFLLRQS